MEFSLRYIKVIFHTEKKILMKPYGFKKTRLNCYLIDFLGDGYVLFVCICSFVDLFLIM